MVKFLVATHFIQCNELEQNSMNNDMKSVTVAWHKLDLHYGICLPLDLTFV